VMADGMDEDSARAIMMDEWIVWEMRERVAPWGQFASPFLFSLSFYNRDSYPGTCTQRDAEGRGFSALWTPTRPSPAPFVLPTGREARAYCAHKRRSQNSR
jgi:hypothetical protein